MNDQTFFKKLQKKQQQMLDEYEQQLVTEHESRIKEIRDEYQQLLDKWEQVKQYTQQTKEAREKFNKFLDTQFQNQKALEQEIEKYWENTTNKYFNDQKNLENWLEQGLKQVENMTGKLFAGKSYEYLTKIINPDSQLKIEQQPDMKHGFTFENQKNYFNYQLSEYVDQKYNNIKHQLYSVLKK